MPGYLGCVNELHALLRAQMLEIGVFIEDASHQLHKGPGYRLISLHSEKLNLEWTLTCHLLTSED